MVLLTMTPALVAALEECKNLSLIDQIVSAKPSLEEPRDGNPVAHDQVISISRLLKAHYGNASVEESERVSYHINDLLRGSKIYVEPPKPKPEPVGQLTSFVLEPPLTASDL